MASELTCLLSQETIQERVSALAKEINTAYQTASPLVIIGILKGGFMFLADLVRPLEMPCQIEFVRLSSYGHQQTSSGSIQPIDLNLPSLTGKHVLVVEDILDTGLTLHYFLNYIQSVFTPQSLRLAVLLDKKTVRKHEIKVDFVGFEIENQYVVGYGLDAAGLYRNLPYIATVNTPTA